MSPVTRPVVGLTDQTKRVCAGRMQRRLRSPLEPLPAAPPGTAPLPDPLAFQTQHAPVSVRLLVQAWLSG